MNILDAYLLQKRKLTIVISSLDTSLLEDISKNLSIDFGAKVINLTQDIVVSNISEINVEKINNKDIDATVKIIISPVYPDNLFSFRINYHINISLNRNLLEEKKIDHKLINLNNETMKSVRINKFLNLHKYNDNKSLEDNIFNIIMEFIKKNLDDGKYLERIKNIENDNRDEYDKMEDNHQNNELDKKIMEDIEESITDPLTDSDISKISMEDIDEDEHNIRKHLGEVITFADTHDDIKFEGIHKKKNEIIGSRQIKLKL